MDVDFILKKDWDNLPSGNYKPSPYFSGRTKEIEIIKNVILHKPSGSVLIGAPRGTGKTDLIYASMKAAKEKNPKFIPVIINASQFQANSKEDLMKTLITRTYTTFIDKDNNVNEDLQSESAALYSQATAKDFEEEYKTEVSDDIKLLDSNENFTISIASVSFDSKKLIDTIKKAVIPSLIPLSVLVASIDLPVWLIFILVVVFTLVAIVLEVEFSIKRGDKREVITSKTDEKKTLSIAKTRYLRDASIGNLEHELKELLELSTKKGHKVAFIIDELDKIAGESGQILDVIKMFKGFFNHADALFLFVGDSGVYKLAEEARLHRDTDARSTLFTQRIFLNRPTVNDIREYLSKVIKPPKGKDTGALQDYIIYRSRMDYYQIQDSVRDLVTSYKEDSPVISWPLSSDSFYEQDVNKQRVIGSLLDEGVYLSKSQSRLSLNDDLIEAAYNTAEIDENLELPIELEEIDYEAKNATQVQLEADVAKYLHVAGIYEREEFDNGGRRFYRYKPTFNAGNSISTLNAPLEFEMELFDVMNKFNRLLMNIDRSLANIFNWELSKEIDQDLISMLNERTNFSDDLYTRTMNLIKDMKSHPSKHPEGQEEIRKRIDAIKQHQVDMVRENTFKLIKDSLDEKKIIYAEIAVDSSRLDPYPSIKKHVTSNAITGFAFDRQIKNPRLSLILVNPTKSIATDSEAMKEAKKNKIVVHEAYHQSESLPNLSKEDARIAKVHSFENFETRISELL